MSSGPTLFSRARAEIVDLHHFFFEWYRTVSADKTHFGRFESVIGDGFRMITPRGKILDSDAVHYYDRANRATCGSDFLISTDDIRAGWESDDTIIVSYIEIQHRGGKHSRRQASAVFTTRSSAPNGVEWRHLHETWLQMPEG